MSEYVLVGIEDYIYAKLYAVHRIVEPQLVPDDLVITEWCASGGCYLYRRFDGVDINPRIVVWPDNWLYAWVGPADETGERVRIEDTEKLAQLFVKGCKEGMA